MFFGTIGSLGSSRVNCLPSDPQLVLAVCREPLSQTLQQRLSCQQPTCTRTFHLNGSPLLAAFWISVFPRCARRSRHPQSGRSPICRSRCRDGRHRDPISQMSTMLAEPVRLQLLAGTSKTPPVPKSRSSNHWRALFCGHVLEVLIRHLEPTSCQFGGLKPWMFSLFPGTPPNPKGFFSRKTPPGAVGRDLWEGSIRGKQVSNFFWVVGK